MLLLHVGGLVVRRITPVAVPRTGRAFSLQGLLRPGALFASLALAGCMSVPVPDLPDRTPTAWAQVPQGQGVAVDARQWWKVLSDPALDGLVDQAIAGNLDLQQATLRLQAVRIVAGTSDSRFLPEITASAKQVQDAAAVDTYFHAGIEAIWDLGLFGAAESAQLSAQASAGNAVALRNAAQVAVIADVVRSYLDLTVAQAQQDLLARQQAVDDRGEQLALVRQRLRLDEPGELELRARQAATVRPSRRRGKTPTTPPVRWHCCWAASVRIRPGTPTAPRRRWVRSRCSRSRLTCCDIDRRSCWPNRK